MHLRLFVFVCSVALSALANAQTPSTEPIDGIRNTANPPVAIINAKIVPSSGKVIDRGTILIRDGKIVEVGTQVNLPAGTRKVDADGKWIYPGMIDAYCEVSIEAPAESLGVPYWNTNVTPQFSIANHYRPNAEQLTKLRKAGITSILAAPSQGIIRGTSSVVSTNEAEVDQLLIASDVAGHVRLTVSFGAGRGGYPSSPMGAVALARQAMLDADWYRKAWQAYRSQPSLPQPENNSALAAISQWIESSKPIIFDTQNEQSAMRADQYAREFGLPAILLGSGREYRLVDRVAALNRPLIIPVNFPKAPNVSTPEIASNVTLQDMMHWELAPENPGKLVKAGAQVAITTHGLQDPSEWRSQLRIAIQRGMSAEAALDAVTSTPAKMLGVDQVLGSIAPGKWASLMIADGELFDEKTKIDETWVQGTRHIWKEEESHPEDGRWELALSGATGKPEALHLTISSKKKLEGSLQTPEAEKAAEAAVEPATAAEQPPSPSDAKPTEPAKEGGTDGKDKEGDQKPADKKPAKESDSKSAKLDGLAIQDLRLHANFATKPIGVELDGKAQLSLVLLQDAKSEVTLQGTILWQDGAVSQVRGKVASKKDAKEPKKESKDESDTKKSDSEKKSAATSPISVANYPLGENGRNGHPERSEWIHFKNATIWTSGPQGKLDGADLLVHNGIIHEIGKGLATPEGALVVDATGRHLSPGIIDCHSHMASDGGINEGSQAVTSEVRIGDFVDATDNTIYYQLAGGVTAANILHGSANPIGGQNQVIKLRWGGVYDDLKMKEAPAGIKFALGENVKQSNRSEAGTRYPQSRMGVEQIIRDRFEAALEYQKQWAAWNKEARGLPPRRDLELEAIAEILRGERWIHCHSYRQDEILAMLRTLEDYKVTIGSLQHILEGFKVAEAMAKHGAMGSSFSDWWGYKFEVVDAIPFNGALMHRMGIVVSFNSDDNELGRHLNHEAAKAVKYGGIAPEEALKFVTLNPAKQLRIDQYVGSLEVGKQADLAVWSGSPLSTLSRCEQTWVDGRKYFDREQDLKERASMAELRRKLIQKILADGSPMGGPGEKVVDPTTLWPRYDEYCRIRQEQE